MFRVDTSSAVTELPAQNEAGNPGYFTQGNAANGLAATVPGQDWFNIVQEELMAVVLSAGLTPAKAATNQVLQAIQLLLAKNGGVYNLKPVVNAVANKLDIFTKSGGAAPDSSNQISIPIPDGAGFTVQTRSGTYLSGTSQIVLADGAGYWGRTSLADVLQNAYLYAIWDGAGIVWALGGHSSWKKVYTTTTPTDPGFMLLEDGSTYTRNASHHCICVGRIQYEYDTADSPDHTIQAATYVHWGRDPNDEPLMIVVADEKTQNTAGGTFTSGAWRTRDLNAIRKNNIPGASVSDNQITLPAGKYRVHGVASAHYVTLHIGRLQNITLGETLINGSSELAGGDGVQSKTALEGTFTIAASSVIEIQHYCQTSCSTNGFGKATNYAKEVYSLIAIEKIGD
ncbi:MAG: hypothetical protein A4E66_00004 [Syntrophus sp. PtaB.Bin001]|nr:MAG: hypothetical protein A4E66_00004 [Syntrophus sp. PtaB.Bin001]